MTLKCGLYIIRPIEDFTLGLGQSNMPIMNMSITDFNGTTC